MRNINIESGVQNIYPVSITKERGIEGDIGNETVDDSNKFLTENPKFID